MTRSNFPRFRAFSTVVSKRMIMCSPSVETLSALAEKSPKKTQQESSGPPRLQEECVLEPDKESGQEKNNKLNSSWPKMARLGPSFDPKIPPKKVYVGPLFAFFPRK